MQLSTTTVLLLVALLPACASVPDRPATSSVGCARATLAQYLPAGVTDKRAHCIAGGLIARYCSPTEARLAGLGKEVRDAFSSGDAAWSDWLATRAGVRCAVESDGDVAAISACCENEPSGRNTGGDPVP